MHQSFGSEALWAKLSQVGTPHPFYFMLLYQKGSSLFLEDIVRLRSAFAFLRIRRVF